jgi:hypothetical protein
MPPELQYPTTRILINGEPWTIGIFTAEDMGLLFMAGHRGCRVSAKCCAGSRRPSPIVRSRASSAAPRLRTNATTLTVLSSLARVRGAPS